MDVGDELFGRYLIVRRIARGGMGTVWEAEDLTLAQRVALKHISFADLPPEQVDETRLRTVREARVAARLRGHPHVVTIFDVIESDGAVWLVLEYLPSVTLAQSLTNREGPLDLGEVARIGAAVADALAAAHQRGIVHRDVKPSNVLIGTDDGVVKLADFGISRAVDEGPITRDDVVSGSPTYMAREVARGDEPTPASDIYSLGATLYRAIEGEPPFGDDPNTNRLLLRVTTGLMGEPTRAGPLTPLVMRLLELTPATRPDAATARDQLRSFATLVSDPTQHLHPEHDDHEDDPESLPDRQPAPAPQARPARRFRRRHVLIAVAALLTIAALGVAIPRLIAGDDKPPVGAPALPSTVGPITLTGDPRAADPCALIDTAWLRQFGEPVITRSYRLQGCRARIATPTGNVLLDVRFAGPLRPGVNLGGLAQRLGDLTVWRRSQAAGDFLNDCVRYLVLADHTRIHVEATGANVDLCALAEVGAASAVNALTRDGITYRPDRNAGLQLAEQDACALLDRATLATVPSLDPSSGSPGFASWNCAWGSSATGAKVALIFRLGDASVPDLGDPTTIAGRQAWCRLTSGDDHPKECLAYVVYRSAPPPTGAIEILEVEVEGPHPPNELCDRATQLAAAALSKLPLS